MAFFRKKQKKQKTEKEEYLFLDPQLDIEAEFRNRQKKEKHEKEFYDIEQIQYIRTQCEQIAESSKYIATLKEEYQIVNSYLSDIQIIESAKESLRREIAKTAEDILQLEAKRKKYRSEPSKLSRGSYQRFEEYEEEFPEALVSLQNDEKYLQAIKHDLRVLEAEKISLKEDRENYGLRRSNLRNISIISLIGIVAVFAIFLASGQLNNGGEVMFMVILALVAAYVFLIYFLQRNAMYMIRITEKKIARAVTLANKTKIKYINIANSVDYQLEKYHVKNSYQLGKEYEVFLQEKSNNERYKKSANDLDESTRGLTALLTQLNLYDMNIWNAQVEALSNPKEMVEVRHGYHVRRQKLREQIDYNMDRIEDAKKAVTTFVTKHPEKAKEVMDMVDSFDVDF